MPKRRIREEDLTGIIGTSPISNTVYIPCQSSAEFAPRLCKSLADLDAIEEVEKTLSYCLAKHLLHLGMRVLIEGIGSNKKVAKESWDRLQDKALYDVRFLTTGEFGQPTDEDGKTPKIDANMIACAEARKDCVALIDFNEDVEGFDYTVVKLNDSQEIEGGLVHVIQSVDSGKAYGLTPWFKTNHADFEEKFGDDRLAKVPACFGYLFSYARAIANGTPENYAIAGRERGAISELIEPCHIYSTAEVEILAGRGQKSAVELDDEADNTGTGINVIYRPNPDWNYVIWGNRTMLKNNGYTKASSYMNIRNMVNAINKSMYNASNAYAFDQNSDTLFINFKNYTAPLLDRFVSSDGIWAYRFRKVATSAKARLKVQLNIVPIEAVEDFDLLVTLADSLEISE